MRLLRMPGDLMTIFGCLMGVLALSFSLDHIFTDLSCLKTFMSNYRLVPVGLSLYMN